MKVMHKISAGLLCSFIFLFGFFITPSFSEAAVWASNISNTSCPMGQNLFASVSTNKDLYAYGEAIALTGNIQLTGPSGTYSYFLSAGGATIVSQTAGLGSYSGTGSASATTYPTYSMGVGASASACTSGGTLSVSVTPPLNCTKPWGGVLLHGSAVTAYQSSSVVSPAWCVSEARWCNNGTPSGSYLYQTCGLLPPPAPPPPPPTTLVPTAFISIPTTDMTVLKGTPPVNFIGAGSSSYYSPTTNNFPAVNPRGITYDPVRNYVWITESSGAIIYDVAKFNASTGARVGTFVSTTAPNPNSIVYEPSSGSVWAAIGTGAYVSKYNAGTGVLMNNPVTGTYAGNFAISASVPQSVWVTTGDWTAHVVTKIRASDGGILGNYTVNTPAEGTPSKLAYDPINDRVWIVIGTDRIFRLNMSGANIGTVLLPSTSANGIAFDSATNSMWVVNSTPHTVTKITLDGTIIGTYNLNLGGGYYAPNDITFDPSSNSMWIANNGAIGNNGLVKVDAYTGVLLGTYPTSLPSASFTGVTYDSIQKAVWASDYSGILARFKTGGNPIVAYEWHEGVCGTGTPFYSGQSLFLATPTVGARIIYLSVKDSFNNWSTNCPFRIINVTSPLLPDLTVAFDVTPITAIASTPITFSGTVSNIGTASTGANFSNFFQVATAVNGLGIVTDLTSSTMATLAVGANAVATSPAYTFPSAGTYSVRVCADNTSSAGGGVISEVDEVNNCGPWTTITVVAPLAIAVSPADYPVTLPSSTISATYTLTNGTSADTNCRLLDYLSNPLNAYTPCTGSMSVTAPSVVGVYGYYIQANKSSAGQTETSNNFTATVSPAPITTVNGACGTSNLGTFSSAPAVNFCNAGTATAVLGTGPWWWSCDGGGVPVGTNASCQAFTNVVAGSCGTANGVSVATAPSANLCTYTSVAPTVTGSGPWNWTCSGANGGANASCNAPKTASIKLKYQQF